MWFAAAAWIALFALLALLAFGPLPSRSNKTRDDSPNEAEEDEPRPDEETLPSPGVSTNGNGRRGGRGGESLADALSPAPASLWHCPHCGASYVDREGGCDFCPGEELVADPPEPAELGKMELLVRVNDYFFAQTLRMRLEAAGVPTRVESWDVMGVGAPLLGVEPHHVHVAANCLERAREILGQLDREAAGWSEDAPPSPTPDE